MTPVELRHRLCDMWISSYQNTTLTLSKEVPFAQIDQIFRLNPQCRSLTISNPFITTLPSPEMFPNLQHLIIETGCYQLTLPEYFPGYSKLESLTIQNVKTAPALHLTTLPSLREFNLSSAPVLQQLRFECLENLTTIVLTDVKNIESWNITGCTALHTIHVPMFFKPEICISRGSLFTVKIGNVKVSSL